MSENNPAAILEESRQRAAKQRVTLSSNGRDYMVARDGERPYRFALYADALAYAIELVDAEAVK